jgi:hypothetical protein
MTFEQIFKFIKDNQVDMDNESGIEITKVDNNHYEVLLDEKLINCDRHNSIIFYTGNDKGINRLL